MHHRTVATALLAMILTAGCTHTPASSAKATEALGQQAAWVLENPTRIEGWNFQGPNGAVYNDPSMRRLDLSVAVELRDILLDDSTYAKIGSRDGFVRDVGFRVWRDEASIDVLVSLTANLILVKTPAYGGQSTSSLSADVSNAHKRLERLAKKAFSEFR